ncbi:hypothetical protein ACSNOD_27845, partial [Streptomyces sp. URMC 123]
MSHRASGPRRAAPAPGRALDPTRVIPAPRPVEVGPDDRPAGARVIRGQVLRPTAAGRRRPCARVRYAAAGAILLVAVAAAAALALLLPRGVGAGPTRDVSAGD